MQIEVYGYSSVGTRAENEDSLAYGSYKNQKCFAVVADGLGGHGGGKQASMTAAEALRSCAGQDKLPTQMQITNWLNEANEKILSLRDGPSHMKTTVVALFVKENQAVWVHIGDSRLYHFHDGRLVDYTLDHSVCQLAVRLGEITRREIPGHPSRNRILKVLGDDEIDPEFHEPVLLEPGKHAFLLCSDGVWERLQEDEILLDLHRSATPEQWVYSLRCRAEMRKSEDVDNNTACAVFIEV